LTNAAESPLSDAGSNDDLPDEFLGALAALGSSAGNARLRDVLEWDEATYDAVKTELLSRGLIVPGRGRGGSVSLADGEAASVSLGPDAARPARRARAARGSSNSTAGAASASGFETAFRAIDDCLRKEAGCGTELDYTEQTSWLLFLKYLDGLEDDRAAMAALEGRSPARSWRMPTAGTAGRYPRMPMASWITTPPSPATTCAIS
jgi:type I restriction enzyme M protein